MLNCYTLFTVCFTLLTLLLSEGVPEIDADPMSLRNVRETGMNLAVFAHRFQSCRLFICLDLPVT